MWTSRFKASTLTTQSPITTTLNGVTESISGTVLGKVVVPFVTSERTPDRVSRLTFVNLRPVRLSLLYKTLYIFST